jgi:integrase
LYYPAGHKTEHHDKRRIVAIGPQAKNVLQPWLMKKLDAFVFRPDRVAGADRNAGSHYTADSYRRAIHRACDRAFPPPKRLQRQYVEASGRKKWRLQTETEWRAALGEKAWAELEQWREDHRWSPNQLRHAKATELRKQYGLEAARLALGHSSADMTAVYAEKDLERLVEIARESG